MAMPKTYDWNRQVFIDQVVNLFAKQSYRSSFQN